jgi:dTDP-4-amino-4,6-dideoxygalactose transaminase
MPADLAALLAIAQRHGLPTVEDAACAIGSEIRWNDRWERIGRPHGDVACFSFHPRKLLSTGDGGMLTTANAEWDRRFRLLRHQGMDVSDRARHDAREPVFESYPVLGFNYRMTDIQAAIGRVQLARLGGMLVRRRLLARRYRELLAGIPGLRLPVEPEWARSNWQSFCIGLPDGCDQRQVMESLLQRGIATRRGVMCAHREPSYERGDWSCGVPIGECACEPGHCERLARSERAQDRSILIPLYSQMTAAEQQRVAEALQDVLTSGPRTRDVAETRRRGDTEHGGATG